MGIKGKGNTRFCVDKRSTKRAKALTQAGKTGIIFLLWKGVERMKRFLCWFLCLTLLCTGISLAAAEDISAADLDEIMLEEDEDEGVSVARVTGKVYPEPTAKDFNASSPALYTCKIRPNQAIYKIPDPDHNYQNYLVRPNGQYMEAEILYVGLQWFIVRRGKDIGYIQRQWVDMGSIKPLDPVNTPAFNVQKHTYTAVTATSCHVRKDMSFNEGAEDDGNNYVILKPGTNITIWKFYDGWAIVNYMREYGYIDPNELTDLKPVSPTDEELYPDCPIAAYTSYYKMVQTEVNISRIHNIRRGCELVSVVLQPGEQFDGNALMGPYGKSRGYEPAIVLVDGKEVKGYGGGTCQVSSTLYNAVIELPGIRVDWRRPHGGNGATYLPIHCDAAVGTNQLNLKFTNMYDFPIRIEEMSNDDGALTVRIYKVQ